MVVKQAGIGSLAEDDALNILSPVCSKIVCLKAGKQVGCLLASLPFVDKPPSSWQKREAEVSIFSRLWQGKTLYVLLS